MDKETFTQLMILATGAGTVLAQMYRESRNRRWSVEDRERIATQVAGALKSEAEELAAALKVETDAARKAVEKNSAAIERVGAAAHAAYKEANGVNVKIEDLNQRLIKQQEAEAAKP